MALDPLYRTTVRLAHEDMSMRPFLLDILRTAKEFPSQKALQTYLKEHPKADKSKHTVEEGSKSPKKDTPKGDAEVKVTVNKKDLEKRRPKIDSADLSAYPVNAEADDLSPEHREEIADYKLSIVGDDARQAVEIARKIKEGIKKGADVCKLNPAICAGNLGLTRDKMPQIEGDKTVKQMLESSNELDKKKGQAMVHAGADPNSDKTILQHMLDHLEKHGVKTSRAEVPVGSLNATQSEIKAEKVYQMADAHLKGKFDKIDDSVVVSKDGHILDGHHRWAALLAIDPAKKMKVKVIDMTMKDLLKEAQVVPGVYKANFEGTPLDEEEQKKYKSESKTTFKKGSLRSDLIRLAHMNKEIKPYILPLLA